jgi:alpha-beta hydrolase superfamily lysophospholipase
MLSHHEATLACAQAFSSTDFRPDPKAFKVPTLIIHGTSDKTVPIDASARAAAAGIAGSRLIEYDGGPHGLLAPTKTESLRTSSGSLAADIRSRNLQLRCSKTKQSS